MAKKMNAMEMLNNIRNKAKLDNNDFTKSNAIRLRAGKIKLQLIALDDEHLFRPRTQHMIPTIPHEDDKSEKWMIADCKGEGCPVCAAVDAFKHSGVELDAINEEYNPKYAYKSLRSVFTQPEHFLLCAKILADQADDGSYLPKDAELGSTHLVQFNRTALNNLMSAYEDYMDDLELGEDEEVPSLFAIFNGEDKAKSLTISCRIANQPYSCTFAFNKVAEIKKSEVDEDKLKLLEEYPQVPEEHYEKCIKRIKDIQNYFIQSDKNDGDDSDLPWSNKNSSKSSNVDGDDADFDIEDML